MKFTSPGFTGVPDRIVIMPGGRLWFVELKTTGEKQTARQKLVTAILCKLGFKVLVIDSQFLLDEFLKTITA